MNYINKSRSIEDLFVVRGHDPLAKWATKRVGDAVVCDCEGLTLTSIHTAHSSGVTVRRDKIQNNSNEVISLRSALSKFVFNGGEHEVYTQYSIWCGERYGAWQPLVTEVCAESDEVRQCVGATPFAAIYNLQNQRGIAFHVLCDSSWCIKVRNCYTQTAQRKNVTVELGINDKNFDLKLAPGECLDLPVILYYEFVNRLDMDAYKLHRFCNSSYPKRRMPVAYNSWMSRFDNISYEILSEQLTLAKSIGAEYFVIDAGWFGKPNEWFGSVGDWSECLDASMAGRMKSFADKVHECGLGFGLWFEIERASLSSQSYRLHPELYLVDSGNAFLNFADRRAQDFILNTLCENIDKYSIDYIKFDFNASLTYDRESISFIDYYKGFKSVISRLKEKYPTLHMLNCASGGLRMCLANIADYDSFWMSDDHSLYSQLEIFKDAVIRMPPNVLEKWLTIRSFDNFEPVYGGGTTEKILVSGDASWGHLESIREGYLRALASSGPLGISCDLTRLSERLITTLKQIVTDFKKERDFWADAECRILCNTESLTVLQFNDSAFNRIKLFTYTALPLQNSVTLYPVTDSSAEYHLSDGSTYCQEEGIDVPIVDRYTANTLSLAKKQ